MDHYYYGMSIIQYKRKDSFKVLGHDAELLVQNVISNTLLAASYCLAFSRCNNHSRGDGIRVSPVSINANKEIHPQTILVVKGNRIHDFMSKRCHSSIKVPCAAWEMLKVPDRNLISEENE